MKLCFIADLNSIHSQKWIGYFCEKGHQVYVLSTSDFWGEFKNAIVYNLSGNIGSEQSSLNSDKTGNFKKHLIKLLGEHPDLLIWLSQKTGNLKRLIKVYCYSKIARGSIREIKPDLVHCLRLPIEGYIGCLADAKPLVISSWGNDFTYWAKVSPIHIYLTKRTMSRADLFFADCQRDIKLGIKYGLNMSRSHNVFPGAGGIDLKSVEKEKIKVSYFKPWGINHKDIILVSFRGFGRWYLNKQLLKAFFVVRKKFRNTKLVLVGSKDNLYYSSLTKLTASLGLNKSVFFIDSIPNNEIRHLIRSSDLIISATSHDGVPNSMLEAIAYGGIPVMSDIPSIREWVKDGWNGYLFDARDPENIARVIVRALENRDSFELMVKRNWSLVSERADYHKNMKLVEEMYRRLVSKAKTQR